MKRPRQFLGGGALESADSSDLSLSERVRIVEGGDRNYRTLYESLAARENGWAIKSATFNGRIQELDARFKTLNGSLQEHFAKVKQLKQVASLLQQQSDALVKEDTATIQELILERDSLLSQLDQVNRAKTEAEQDGNQQLQCLQRAMEECEAQWQVRVEETRVSAQMEADAQLRAMQKLSAERHAAEVTRLVQQEVERRKGSDTAAVEQRASLVQRIEVLQAALKDQERERLDSEKHFEEQRRKLHVQHLSELASAQADAELELNAQLQNVTQLKTVHEELQQRMQHSEQERVDALDVARQAEALADERLREMVRLKQAMADQTKRSEAQMQDLRSQCLALAQRAETQHALSQAIRQDESDRALLERQRRKIEALQSDLNLRNELIEALSMSYQARLGK